MSSSNTYAVQGMTCSSCAGKVTSAVGEVPGIDGTVVNLTTGTLTVSGDAIDDTAVRSAIQKAGYQTT